MTIRFFTFLLLCLSSIVSFSQEDDGPVKERYLSYKNTKENALLFDRNDPTGFYNLIQAAFARFSPEEMDSYRSMSPEDAEAVLKALGKPWYELENMNMYLGGSSSMPLVTAMGEDSMITYTNGYTNYVYPPRDTLLYMSADYDEIVVKEFLETDYASGKESWKPEELLLLKKFPSMPKPVVTAYFPLRLLYFGDEIRIITNCQPALSDSLLRKQEAYLADVEQRFGTTDYYNEISENVILHGRWNADPNGFFRYSNLSFIDELRGTQQRHTYSSMLKVMSSNPNVSFRITEERIPLDNYYDREDSVVFNADGEIVREAIYVDTLFYVKKGFTGLHYCRTISYNYDEHTWSIKPESLMASAVLIPGERPLVVYAAERSWIIPSGEGIAPGDGYERYRFAIDNNPFKQYLARENELIVSKLPWEEQLSTHSLSFTEVKAP